MKLWFQIALVSLCWSAVGCVGGITDFHASADAGAGDDDAAIGAADAAPPQYDDAGNIIVPDAAPPGTPDAAPPTSPDASIPSDQPGSHVTWLSYPAQNGRTGTGWGTALTDIVQHCPDSQVDYYWVSGDLVASGHEISHGIHAYLRNNYNNTGGPANGFYVLDDRAVIVAEPDIRKSDAIPFIPSSLRGYRYDLYIAGQVEWDDTPLYVWDEWNAYLNGTSVAVALAQNGQWNDGQQDICAGPMEFVIYSLGIAMATADGDPSYFAGNQQFREFLAWQLDRSLDLFRTCQTFGEFGSWPSVDALYAGLRTGSAGAPMREFLAQTYGEAWTEEILDL